MRKAANRTDRSLASLVASHAEASRSFLDNNELDAPIAKLLDEHANARISLSEASRKIRALFKDARFPTILERQILVATQTDPDWVPLMRKAAAIKAHPMALACFDELTDPSLKEEMFPSNNECE